ncbi:MAG: ComEC/Rec2 family competence protein [Flavobacteriales bacterium]
MKFWTNNPGIRILFPLVLGIMAAVNLKLSHYLIPLFCVFSLFIFLIYFWFSTFRNRKWIGVVISFSVFLVGYQYTISRTQNLQESHFSHTITQSDYYHIKIIDRLVEKENSYKAILQVNSSLGEEGLKCDGKVLAYFRKSDQVKMLKYGDELIIENKINKVEGARNPKQFDYSRYLNLHQINYQVFLDSNTWHKTGANSGNFLVKFSQKMRQKLYSYLQENGVVGKQLQVGSALLLGLRENLDKELMKSYSSAGAMHVLAVSGLHVGILYLLLSNFLNLFKRLRKSNYLIAIILISVLWFYALMTGLSASVMRSSTMFTFIIVGDKLLGRKVSIYNTLAVSALVLLIIDPYMIYQVGFQLSYAAVLGIVYLQPKLYKLLYFNNTILQKIWAITCVSIAAQIATFPMTLYYFHQFPVYFFVSNLIVIPSAVLIFYLGIGLFVIAPFGGLSLAVGKILNFLLWILNQAIFMTEKLPYSLIEEMALSVFETYLLYLLTFIFLIALYYRRLKFLYATLTLAFIFISIQLVKQYDSTQQQYLTFYSIKNETVFELVDNKKVYFVSSSEFKDDWNKMLFNVNNNWNNHNLTSKVYFDVDSLSISYEDKSVFLEKGVFNFKNTTIQVLDKEFIQDINPDFLIVNKPSLKLLKSYLQQAKPETVIFDSTIPEYKLKYYTDKIDSNFTKVVSLDKKYYSVELTSY